jgi:long-chain-alcohol oxidase
LPPFRDSLISDKIGAAVVLTGPVDANGETWECKNLFVADASVFPTSLGINPMITVEAVAFMLSRSVMNRLGVSTAK